MSLSNYWGAIPTVKNKQNKKNISLFVSCHSGVVTVKKLNVQKCATRADKYLFCKGALSLCFKPRLSAKLFT